MYRFWAVGLAHRPRPVDRRRCCGRSSLVGAVLALPLAHRLNLLALGDDVATALGQRVGVTPRSHGGRRRAAAGTATALAGPIALVGLVVPHAARRLVGTTTGGSCR